VDFESEGVWEEFFETFGKMVDSLAADHDSFALGTAEIVEFDAIDAGHDLVRLKNVEVQSSTAKSVPSKFVSVFEATLQVEGFEAHYSAHQKKNNNKVPVKEGNVK
jgi:hypothetical protein